MRSGPGRSSRGAGRPSRRCCSPRRCARTGSPHCGTPGAGPCPSSRPHRPDVVVDGIVGIGGRPGLRPEAEAALARFGGVPVVAVDVPSGVDVDTGRLEGAHVRADVTVTFGTHKIAHLVDPAAQACGVVHLVDIGLDLPGPRSRRSSRSTSPRCCRFLARSTTSTPAVSSGSVPARRPTPGQPCCARPARGPVSPGWCATSARPPTPCALGTRRSSTRRAGCRPGWSARAATPTPSRRSPRPWPTGCRRWSTPMP